MRASPPPRGRAAAPLGAGPVVVALTMTLALAAGAARADELAVLAAGATESTLRLALPSFEAQTGHTVKVSYGAVGLLRDRVLAGSAADLVIVTPAIVEVLQARALLGPDPRVDLGRVGGGVAVRTGVTPPAVDSPEALRAALLAAEAIYYADPATATAGAHLLAVADQLGVGEVVRQRGHTAAGGKEAMRLLAASSGPAIGLTQISEILPVAGVVLVGPYPASLQRSTTYAGVVPAAAARPEAARALLRFLRSTEVQARFRQAGFEPAP